MRNLLLKDLGWKLFSLFLATAIWLTVHKINDESEVVPAAFTGDRVTFDLPVLIVSRASDVRDFRVEPGTVSVTVAAPPEVIATLEGSEIRPLVDLSDIAGAKDLSRRVEVSAPAGVTLVSVDPTNVVVRPPPH
jgi:YbbR domain-containing protein